MIALGGLRLSPGEQERELLRLAARALRIRTRDVAEWRILKKSLDARKKEQIRWLYRVALTVRGDENAILSRCPAAEKYTPYRYEIPRAASGDRPVVVGFGPAGMFAALLLAEAGLRPVVLERGADVDARTAAVRRFWETGILDEQSNVQFGEGGAGTFSDGKLGTGIRDDRIAFVLEQLHRFGAPEHILWDARPHVGTDVLSGVVKRLREHVISLGGEVRFCHRLTGIVTENGVLSGVTVAAPAGEYPLACRELILAPGHSARDTFAALHGAGVPMERKPFAMGVRIEHRQAAIGFAQYGKDYVNLPPADYRLAVHLPDGASAYTFCMCPGGYVVAAASEAGGVCTNGMSYSGRGGENANSALLVTLHPEAFPGEGVLAGVAWQRELERACFRAGGGTYAAPAQTVGDFLAGKPSEGPGTVQPSYRPGVRWCDLHAVLPRRLTDTLEQAIPALGKKLRGFDDPDAVLTAPETRSSCPLRILRNAEKLMSTISGLYPCGEGAGYAGGISSAAVDGMKCAEKIIGKYRIDA